MTNKISLREFMAWTTLVLAIILFGFTVSFAQSKNVQVTNENGKIHILMDYVKDGKKIKLDSTFTADDNSDIDKLVESITGDKSNSDVDKQIVKKNKRIIIDCDIPKLSEKEIEKIHEDIRESMKNMHEDFSDLQNSLKKMHIHINKGTDNDFDFELPDFNFSGHHEDADNSDLDGLDSLHDKNHFIVVGKPDEKPPVLERVITSKNGNQIFVYKRSATISSEEEPLKGIPGLTNLDIFPNPSEGKFNIKFNTAHSADIKIQILDQSNKEIYMEKLYSIEGDFSKEINLSHIGKGSYLIKISLGKNAVTRKIIIN